MTSDVKKLIGVLLVGTMAAGPLSAETLDAETLDAEASLVELACLLNVNRAAERLGVVQSALAQADENLRVERERCRHGFASHTEALLRLSSDMNAMYEH